MYGFAVTTTGVEENDEQLLMVEDIEKLRGLAVFMLEDYPEQYHPEIADWIKTDLNEEVLDHWLRVALEILDLNITIRAEKVW